MNHAVRLLAAIALCAGLAGFVVPASAAELKCEPQKIATKYPGLKGRTLKVGISAADRPTSYRDETDPNKVIGFDADYARATFACIGIPFEFAIGGWSGLMPALIAGQTDVMWDQLYYTPERGKQADFVLYSSSGSSIVVAKGNPKKIHSLDDLCGHRAVGQIGSTEVTTLQGLSAKCVEAKKPEIDIHIGQDRPSGLLELANDRVDAYLGIAVAYYDPAVYEIAYGYSTGVRIGVAVKKGDKDLVQAIFDSIKLLQDEGAARKFYEAYRMNPGLSIPAEILAQ